MFKHLFFIFIMFKQIFKKDKPVEVITNKKLITIQPCGIYGFYVMGVIYFIKENYNLSNYIFSGASAGSWNSLLLTHKDDTRELINNIIDKVTLYQNTKSINKLEHLIKEHILNNYKSSDFELNKLFIGLTDIKFNTIILSEFNNLEDAINGCISSSHIPFVTGGLFNCYRNKYYFDGGFSKYPYLKIINSSLHINPNIWNKKRNYENIIISTMLKKKYNAREMFDNGYEDTKQNKKNLDNIFNK